MRRVPKPCRTCGTPTSGSYCPTHARNRNLARTLLDLIYQRDGGVCQLGQHPCPRADATLDHIDRVVTNDTPVNLRLACRSCNSSRH